MIEYQKEPGWSDIPESWEFVELLACGMTAFGLIALAAVDYLIGSLALLSGALCALAVYLKLRDMRKQYWTARYARAGLDPYTVWLANAPSVQLPLSRRRLHRDIRPWATRNGVNQMNRLTLIAAGAILGVAGVITAGYVWLWKNPMVT